MDNRGADDTVGARAGGMVAGLGGLATGSLAGGGCLAGSEGTMV